jgi:hypothetical protein
MEKQCAAEGCENTFEAKGARKFCPDHATGGAKASTRSAEPDDAGMVVALDVCEKQLDRIWASATLEEKGLGIQSILDYQRDQE